VFANSQACVSEENESLTNSPKVAFASRQTYISVENDFGIYLPAHGPGPPKQEGTIL